MAQSVKHLPCKQRDLSRVLGTHFKKLVVVACIYNVITWEAQTSNSLGLVGQTVQPISELQTKLKALLQKREVDGWHLENGLSSPHTHVDMCAHICICMYTHSQGQQSYTHKQNVQQNTRVWCLPQAVSFSRGQEEETRLIKLLAKMPISRRIYPAAPAFQQEIENLAQS